METDKILSYGSFKVKHWILTGDDGTCRMVISQNGSEKILGLKFNFSSRYKGIRTGPNSNPLNLLDIFL